LVTESDNIANSSFSNNENYQYMFLYNTSIVKVSNFQIKPTEEEVRIIAELEKVLDEALRSTDFFDVYDSEDEEEERRRENVLDDADATAASRRGGLFSFCCSGCLSLSLCLLFFCSSVCLGIMFHLLLFVLLLFCHIASPQ